MLAMNPQNNLGILEQNLYEVQRPTPLAAPLWLAIQAVQA
jgi:hypothetical protein